MFPKLKEFFTFRKTYKKPEENTDLQNQIAEQTKQITYLQSLVKQFDEDFDFSMLWVDQEEVKSNLFPIINLILLFIGLIILIFKH